MFTLTSCVWTGWQDFVDTDDDIDLEIHRYDRLVDEFVSLNSYTALERMHAEYPEETMLLIEDVLNLGNIQEPRIENKLRTYCMNPAVQTLLRDVHDSFPNLDALTERMNEAFTELRKADPNFKVPKVYAQISALNQSIVVGDSVLGISLDKYLGADYPLYKRYYYDFQRRSLSPERILPDALSFYLMSEYAPSGEEGETALVRIMFIAKIHWIVAQITGESSMMKEVGFDEKRVKWCTEHENEIRSWLVDSRVLESRELNTMYVLLHARENTPALGEDSADQIGVWVGVRALELFLQKNPDLTIADLLFRHDYAEMFRQSGYLSL